MLLNPFVFFMKNVYVLFIKLRRIVLFTRSMLPTKSLKIRTLAQLQMIKLRNVKVGSTGEMKRIDN